MPAPVELKVVLETGDIHVVTKPVNTGLELLREVTRAMGITSHFADLFGLFRKMTVETPEEWVYLNRPLSPCTIHAGQTLRLFLRMRIKPDDIRKLCERDPNAAMYLQNQIARQITTGRVVISDLQLGANVCALQILLHLIEDYHRRQLRCSSVSAEDMASYFTETYELEAFLPQCILDADNSSTCLQAIRRHMGSLWPIRETVAVTKFLQYAMALNVFPDEDFTVNASTPTMRSSETIVSVGTLTGIRYSTAPTGEAGLQYEQVHAININDSCNVSIVTSQGVHAIKTSSQLVTDNLVTLIEAHCVYRVGRAVAKYADVNLPYGTGYGVLQRAEAQEILARHGTTEGLYLIRKSPSNPEQYGLSVCKGGGVDHFKVKKFPSGKYGIGTGLHFLSMDELTEHYHFYRDGLSHVLVKNVILLEQSFDETYDVATTAAANSFRLDHMAYVLDESLDDDPRPRKTLEDIEVHPSNIRLGKELGSGEFGTVLEAVLTRAGESALTVAVKQLKAAPGSAAEREFKREAEVMVALDHPHIVRLLGVCSSSPMILVCEMMAEGPINKYLRANRNDIPPQQLVTYLVQIADGMKYLEAVGFVHRDLAARNILVADRDTVKIADFGLSRVIEHSDYYRAEARGKWPIKWYAPEAILYNKFSSKGDVWSFGVTSWEVLQYGQKPYRGLRGRQVLEAINEGGRLPRPQDCPVPLYNLMLKCWDYEPENRPTFTEVHTELSSLPLGFEGTEGAEVVSQAGTYQNLVNEQTVYDMVADNKDADTEARRPGMITQESVRRMKASPRFIAFEHITLHDTVGTGAFGIVCKASMQTTEGAHVVAVKFLKVHTTEEQQKQLMDEAKVMHALRHPHLVQLLGISMEKDVCLITEYVPHGALHKYLQANKTLDQRTLLTFAYQIADAMAYMASRKFVHRDLAARNVLVASPTVCKVTDFGLSRALGKEKEYYRSKNRGTWPIKWYAPESLYYSKFDARSDMWSFGVTMWEIFAYGQKPYKGMKGREVILLIKRGERLSKPQGSPEWVYKLMLSCWDVDPARRPTFIKVTSMLKRALV